MYTTTLNIHLYTLSLDTTNHHGYNSSNFLKNPHSYPTASAILLPTQPMVASGNHEQTMMDFKYYETNNYPK